jgi:hypothetical protein
LAIRTKQGFHLVLDGKKSYKPRADVNFPVSLPQIERRVTSQWFSAARAHQHTILPFYRPFNSRERYGAWLKDFHIGKVGISKSMGRCNLPILKACVLCAAEDQKSGREPYFRCSHQIVGNLACAHHSVLLKAIRFKKSDLPYRELADYKEILAEQPQSCHAVWLDLANDMEEAPSHFSGNELSNFWIKFRAALGSQGFGTRWRQLALDYLQTASAEIPEYLSGGMSWYLQRGLGPHLRTVQPAQCLLLIRAIGLKPQDFVGHRFAPLEEEKWPCSNRFCAHNGQDAMVLKKILKPLSRGDLRRIVLECPFCERRVVQYKDKKLRAPFYTQILNFGRSWNEKFKKLWLDPKISYSRLREVFAISQQSLALFHAAHLNGLPLDRGGLPCYPGMSAKYRGLPESRFKAFKMAGGTPP